MLKGSAELSAVIRNARDGVAGPLQRLSHALFGAIADDQVGMREPLEALEAILLDLDIEPVRVGSAGPENDAERYSLIFLDYYLGAKGRPSVEKSRDRIMEVTARYSDDEMPIVVLMSSDLSNQKQARNFRDKAELLGCQFKFVPKQQFKDAKIELVSSLAEIVDFLPQNS